MAEEKRALAIGAGGTIRTLADRGVLVTTMVLATGNEGYTRIEERDTIVERRRRERNSAQRILSPPAHCLHAPVGRLHGASHARPGRS
jgi:LmbE family N-acetylglucosaminyl deacetylase